MRACVGEQASYVLTAEPTHHDLYAPSEGLDLPYFVAYNAVLCIMLTRIFGPNFQGKISFISIFNSIIYYLYLETKPIIVFQGIILYMDIINYILDLHF